MAHGAGALTAAGEGRYGGAGGRVRVRTVRLRTLRCARCASARALLFVAVLAATVAHGQVKQSVAAAYGAAEQALVVRHRNAAGSGSQP